MQTMYVYVGLINSSQLVASELGDRGSDHLLPGFRVYRERHCLLRNHTKDFF